MAQSYEILEQIKQIYGENFQKNHVPGLQKRNDDKDQQEGHVEFFRVMKTFCILIMVCYTNIVPNPKKSVNVEVMSEVEIERCV